MSASGVAKIDHITSISLVFLFHTSIVENSPVKTMAFHSKTEKLIPVSPLFYKVLERTSSATGQQRLWMPSE